MNTFSLSCEFFPPRTPEGLVNLVKTAEGLSLHAPEFFSVTFGAGGSTQQRTLETVQAVKTATKINTTPHLSCINNSKAAIAELLHHYQQQGINRLVALRGDIPSGAHNDGELRYANELVQFIRETTGDHFHLTVGAYPEYHPQAKNPQQDFEHFANKVRAGANMAITQYFFNPDAYLAFVDRCQAAKLSIPIIPGIMPITNYQQLARFSDTCGAEIPRWIRQKLAYYDAKEDNASLQAFGEAVVTRLCQTLLEQGAPGLHFYTLNKREPTEALISNLKGQP